MSATHEVTESLEMQGLPGPLPPETEVGDSARWLTFYGLLLSSQSPKEHFQDGCQPR